MSRPGEQGFTLVELLVTLTLLSLLLALLFGGLRFGVRAWDGAQAHGEGSDEMRVVQALLRHEIEQAYPSFDARDPLHPVVNFTGERESVTFLAPAPDAAGTVGRSWITLSAGREGQEEHLAMRAVPELARTGRWSSAILRNVAAVRFSYFGDGGWTDTWRNAKTMPQLVRVHVEFKAGDRRVWPDLIVAPRIDPDVACTAGGNVQGCPDHP